MEEGVNSARPGTGTSHSLSLGAIAGRIGVKLAYQATLIIDQ